MTQVIQTQNRQAEDEIAALTRQIDQLEQALASRDLIGQAKGILMERYRITADEAFERIRKASQQSNRKLAGLAADLAATGQWPPQCCRSNPRTEAAAACR